ncbi:MAG: hypothetical protein WC717_00645 [Candidatus Micrarchaeia archaeon]
MAGIVRAGSGARQLAGELAQQRAWERKAFFDKAAGGLMARARLAGAVILGRDRNGAAVETLKPEELGMMVDAGKVTVGFGREDAEALSGKGWREVEGWLRQDRMPHKEVKETLPIITAVRMLAHISESYGKEIEETEKALGALDLINAILTDKGRHGNEDLGIAVAALEGFGKGVLAKKRAAVKRTVAAARLEKAAGMLKEASGMPPGNKRDFAIWAACAVFTSVRNRAGGWRDSKVALRAERARLRENSLRVLRDAWLLGRLVMFAKEPGRAGNYQEIYYMLEGLGKSDEPYLGKLAGELKLAYAALRKREFGDAQGHFIVAAEHMQGIFISDGLPQG